MKRRELKTALRDTPDDTVTQTDITKILDIEILEFEEKYDFEEYAYDNDESRVSVQSAKQKIGQSDSDQNDDDDEVRSSSDKSSQKSDEKSAQ